jgi:hypothetical protein
MKIADETLKTLLGFALARFYKNDKEIIEKKGTEQASVARIFYYLQDAILHNEEFKELKYLNLDSEYNKQGDESKIMGTHKIRPDILVHKRGCNENNLFVLEFKTWSNTNKIEKDGETISASEWDKRKLKALTHPDGAYHYQLGAFVKLGKENSEITFFERGEEIGG